MGFNTAFKGLKLLKNPGNGRLNNLNDPVLNVLKGPKALFYALAVFLYWPQINSEITRKRPINGNKPGKER